MGLQRKPIEKRRKTAENLKNHCILDQVQGSPSLVPWPHCYLAGFRPGPGHWQDHRRGRKQRYEPSNKNHSKSMKYRSFGRSRYAHKIGTQIETRSNKYYRDDSLLLQERDNRLWNRLGFLLVWSAFSEGPAHEKLIKKLHIRWKGKRSSTTCIHGAPASSSLLQ